MVHQISGEFVIARRTLPLLLCAIKLMKKKILIGAKAIATKRPKETLEFELFQPFVHYIERVLLETGFLVAFEAVVDALHFPFDDAVKTEN